MDQAGWKKLAQERVEDAAALIATQRWACAYYVAGYAVECALKSCVLKYVCESGVVFDKPEFFKDCKTHELPKLLTKADLDQSFGQARGANPKLEVFWGVVKDWSEESRYQAKTEAEARQLVDAITDPTDGVLTWIKTRW